MSGFVTLPHVWALLLHHWFGWNKLKSFLYKKKLVLSYVRNLSSFIYTYSLDQVNVDIVSGAEVVALVRDNLTTENRDKEVVMRPV